MSSCWSCFWLLFLHSSSSWEDGIKTIYGLLENLGSFCPTGTPNTVLFQSVLSQVLVKVSWIWGNRYENIRQYKHWGIAKIPWRMVHFSFGGKGGCSWRSLYCQQSQQQTPKSALNKIWLDTVCSHSPDWYIRRNGIDPDILQNLACWGWQT